MFTDPARVGRLAVAADDVAAGEDAALFRMLIACAMFQAQRDIRVFSILCSLPKMVALELGDQTKLLKRAHSDGCEYLRDASLLHRGCDAEKRGAHTVVCGINAEVRCAVKEHGLHLKRYGDFGKIPTSAALVVQEAAGAGLAALYARTLDEERSQIGRARALEARLLRIWRVSKKTTNLFLAVVCNPDLSRHPPWKKGIAWTEFVVIDRHVESFLESISAVRASNYEGRRRQLHSLAAKIDLRAIDRRVRSYNPQIVASAIYHFMSASNRRAATMDCCRAGPEACRRCPRLLAALCPVRQPSSRG